MDLHVTMLPGAISITLLQAFKSSLCCNSSSIFGVLHTIDPKGKTAFIVFQSTEEINI